MSIQLKNKKFLNDYLLTFARRIEQALIFNLEALVAELQNHAKENAGYNDQTANLKSSIGGVVLKDGKPITYSGFDGETEGEKEGKTFINSLISNFNKGYVILIVAGMEYATYVENYHGLNVLKKSELKLERELLLLVNRLKRRIDALK